MKQATLKGSTDILKKIGAIEKDMMDLKLSVLRKIIQSKGKVVSFRGVLKGVDVSERDISKAKKSLYGKTAV